METTEIREDRMDRLVAAAEKTAVATDKLLYLAQVVAFVLAFAACLTALWVAFAG